jgi:predicted nuclease of predicted toxin-antitoxin system
MRLLLDECLPKRLKRAFAGFEVSTVPEMGWAGVKDGALLRLALEAGFDVFITVDAGIQY